jgi:hypothetical protein
VNPGPEVAVQVFAPPQAAPRIVQMEAISSSICRKTPRTLGRSRDINSVISEAGVIGYPAKKRHPAAMAPRVQASFP